MKKILFCIPYFITGGVESTLVRFANGLAENGEYEVGVLFLGKVEKNFIYDQFLPQITKIIIHENCALLGQSKPKGSLARKYWKFRCYFAKRHLTDFIPDFASYDILVDFKQGVSNFCLKNRLPHQKIMVWMHGSFSVINQFIKSNHLLNYDGLVALTDSFKASFIKTYPAHQHKIYKLFNPVDIQHIADLAIDQTTLSEVEKCQIDQPFFVHISRIDFDKDLTTVIKAYQVFLQNTNSTTKLFLIGDGRQMKFYRRMIDDLNLQDQVFLLGEKTNPFIWMHQAKASILSSYNEGLPCTLIESLASNGLTVSSDCPNGPAEILGYGKYGLLFEPGDFNRLADILTAIDSGRIKRETYLPFYSEALERFDQNTIIQQLQQILKDVC